MSSKVVPFPVPSEPEPPRERARQLGDQLQNLAQTDARVLAVITTFVNLAVASPHLVLSLQSYLERLLDSCG